MKAIAIATTLVLGLVGTGLLPVHAGWDPNLEKKAQQTIQAFKKRDPSLKTFFQKAYGYVVFPKIYKGGMGIGGARGKGVVYRRGRAIGTATLTQGTIGFQFGGQAYSEVIFFESKAALKRFTDGNFELAAQATAVAADKGVAAHADYSGGVAVFTMTIGGLMYEASVGGQKFSFKPKK